MVWLNESFDLLLFHLHVFLLLLDCHDESTIRSQLILTFWCLHRWSTRTILGLRLFNSWMRCRWLGMACIFVALSCWHTLRSITRISSRILSLNYFSLTTICLLCVLMILTLILLTYHINITLWLVSNARASSNRIDTWWLLYVTCWCWILAWLNIWVLCTIHIRYLKCILTCLILSIAVLLA